MLSIDAGGLPLRHAIVGFVVASSAVDWQHGDAALASSLCWRAFAVEDIALIGDWFHAA
jgi:hypothetical protein